MSTLSKVIATGSAIGLGVWLYWEHYRSHQWIVYHTNGKMSARFSCRGTTPHGDCTRWFEDGTVRVTCHYKDGELDGDYTEYNRSVSPCTVTHYVGGRIEGEYTEYYENGKVWFHGHYRGDKRHGRFTWFHRDGRPSSEVDYADGKIVRVVSLYDNKGRDCALGDGELIVWKVAKARVQAETDAGGGTGIDAGGGTGIEAGGGTGIEAGGGTGIDAGGEAGIEAVREWTPVYVRLTVPADAKRVTPREDGEYLYKSRVEFARVEEIVDREGTQYREARTAIWKSDTTIYKLGEMVHPDQFDPNPQHACGSGIHVHRHQDHCDKWHVWKD